jgi:hypothetical protein
MLCSECRRVASTVASTVCANVKKSDASPLTLAVTVNVDAPKNQRLVGGLAMPPRGRLGTYRLRVYVPYRRRRFASTVPGQRLDASFFGAPTA